MTAESRACEIVANVLTIQRPVAISDDMETLENWSSLTHMSLVLEIEEEIGRQLRAEEIVSISSVRAIANLLAGSKADSHHA
jgi:acyl carrier protein